MNVPSDCKYTKDHEWVRGEGKEVVVGITDYAQGELGDVVFVDLPAVGKTVKRGEALCQVESVKAVSDVYAPLDARVVEVNTTLSASPELINSAPYEGGWLARIEVTNGSQLAELMDAGNYKTHLEKISK